jgi:hypothetical protein
VFEVVPAVCRHGGFKRGRPLFVGLCQSPNLIWRQVSVGVRPFGMVGLHTLVVIGWIMGLAAIVAVAWPQFEGWVEDVVVTAMYWLM